MEKKKTKIDIKTKGVAKAEVKKESGAKPHPAAQPPVAEKAAVCIFGLHSLKPPKGARTRKKLLGRGSGSGHGKTSTRGFKGQTSRSGRDFYPGFEGGQTPLIRRIPKRGFNNTAFKKIIYQIINLRDLVAIKEQIIEPAILQDKGLIRDKEKPVKILGDGSINNPVTVKAHAFSKAARGKIEKAGGKIEIINV